MASLRKFFLTLGSIFMFWQLQAQVPIPETYPPNGNIYPWGYELVGTSWDTSPYIPLIFNRQPFRILLPNGVTYDEATNTFTNTTGKTYPVMLFFHGAGEDGFNNNHQLRHGGRDFLVARDNGKFDGIALFPQNFTDFFGPGQIDILEDLIDNLVNKGLVDPFRVSVNGLSSGGTGVWIATTQYSKMVASSLPMSAVNTTDLQYLNNFIHIPVWLAQGGKDKKPLPSAAIAMVDAINDAGGDATLQLYPDLGHGVWNTFFREPDFFPWLMRANKTNPLVYYGRNEFCPGDPINARMGVTAGFQGYEWRKDGVVIPGANSHEYTATEFGVYDVRIRRNGVWSYWSPTPVVVQVKQATVTPPIEVAGLQSNVLPALDDQGGVELTVPNDYETYEWINVTTGATVGTEKVFKATVPGSYAVTVTEPFGCSSNFSDPFVVIDANGAGAPPAPFNPLGFATSTTSLQLFWGQNTSPANNETGFEIYKSETAGGPYSLLEITAADAESYNDYDLKPNTTYYYLIRAVNENGASDAAEEVAVTTQVDSEAPTAPLNLTVVSVNSNSVTLQWDASSDNAGVFKYDIFKNGAKTLAVDGSLTQATIYGLKNQTVFNFMVKARDVTGNLSEFSNQVTAATVNSGLIYKYYHGSFNKLPDFSTLTPVKTGLTDNIDIGLREQNDNFAFLWEGFINIPVSGNYTFETYSDDGSKLYIGGFSESNLVVNNDGLHGGRYRGGTVNLEAGSYPIYVTFFEKGGGQSMSIYWSNTAHGVTNRQKIPNSAFIDDFELPGSPPEAPDNLVATAADYQSINLNWDDNSNNETGFQLFRSDASVGPFVPIGVVGPDQNSFTDSGLEANTKYYYSVSALGQYGSSNLASGGSFEGGLVQHNFENNLNDDSGNGVASILRSGATYSTDSKVGDYSLSSPSGSSYIDVDNGNQFIHSAFTQRSVAFWMKAASTSGIQDIFDEGGSTNGFGIRINNNKIEVAFQNQHNIQLYSAPFTAANQWVHVAVTFDNGSSSLYINGVLAASKNDIPFTQVDTHGNGGGFGATNGGNGFDSNNNNFIGNLDDFLMTATALTQEEILSLITEAPSATTLPLPAAPAAPENLVANGLSSSAIELSWDDASNNEDGFRVYRSINGNSNFLLLADSITGNSFLDDNVSSVASYYYKVSSFNAGGESESNEAIGLTVNSDPDINAVADYKMRFDESLTIELSATDPDGAANLTFSSPNLPAFGSISSNGNGTGSVSFNPSVTDQAEYSDIVIVVTDNGGGVDSDTFNLSVNDNNTPVISSIDDISLAEGQSTSVNVTYNDANNDPLTFDLVDWPAFVTFDDNGDGTGTLNVEPGFADGGSYDLEMKLSDDQGSFTVASFNVTVAEVPIGTKVYVNYQSSVAAAAPWNNIRTFAALGLNDTKGNSTTITHSISPNAWYSWTDGQTTGDNSGAFPDDVLAEYYYFGIFGAPETADITLSGLNPGMEYNLSILGGSKWTGTADNGNTVYTVNGQEISLDVQNNSQNTADFNNVTPNASGVLVISMRKDVGTPVGYINGFTLSEAFDGNSIPAAPREVAATVDAGVITVSWYDAPFNETHFDIYKSESENGTYTRINTSPIPEGSTSFDDSDAVEGATYFYKLKSVNEFGESDFSGVASVLVPNVLPEISVSGDLEVVAGSNGVINITATDPPGNLITLAADGLPVFAGFTDLGGGNGTVDLSPGAEDAGSYSFTVTATDDKGGQTVETVNVQVNEDKLYSVSLNFSQNINASSPWNNTSKIPATNDVFSNLQNDSNQNSGISVELLTFFGGAFNAGPTTGNNSGIVPDNVLREYYYFGVFGSDSEMRLKVSGLKSDEKYTFKFVASSVYNGLNITDNGYTIFHVGNQSSSVHVQANTTDLAVIQDVIADSNGEVVVRITKNAVVGYLNGMIIEAFESEEVVFSPVDLTAAGVTNSSIQLTWEDQNPDETLFEIYRSSTADDASFTKYDEVPANTTTYTDGGLERDEFFYYKVRAKRADGTFTDYTNTSGAATLSYSIFVNVNGDAAYNTAAPWNNLATFPDAGTVHTDLFNDLGQPTGIEMAWAVGMQGANDWGTSTGDNSGIYPDNVLKSFYFNDAFDAPGEYMVTGLSQDYRYNFKFLGSIDVPDIIFTDFTVNGETVTNSQTKNISEASVVSNVAPNENSEAYVIVKETPVQDGPSSMPS